MTPDDAEEYTQSLGQITGGLWRQIAWADQQGIPAALGLTLRQWVGDRLGGYVKLDIPERREAVAELTDEGMTQREIGDVLGISPDTVNRDLKPVRNRTAEPEETQASGPEDPAPVRNRTAEPNPLSEAIAEARSAPVVVGARVIEYLERSMQQINQVGGIDAICRDMLASPVASINLPLWTDTLARADQIITDWRKTVDSAVGIRRIQ